MKKKILGIIIGIIIILSGGGVYLLTQYLITEQQKAQDNRISIEIMTYSVEQEEFYQDIKQVFEEEHPNIRLDFITLPGSEYQETIELLFESEQSPDIFYQSGGFGIIAELLEKGWIQPISFGGNESLEFQWKERFPNDSFIEGSTDYKNETYSFSHDDFEISGLGYMFFNKDVLRDAGLDPELPPTTWSGFINACRTIEIQTNSSGIAISLSPNTQIKRIWNAIAGSIMTNSKFDYKNGRFAIDHPRKIAAFEFIQSLYNESLVWYDPIDGYDYNKKLARQAMATGLAAFSFDGDYIPSVLNNMGFNSSNLDLGVALPPFPDNWSRGALAKGVTGTGFWVSNQSKHPEEVWIFIEWITRPEGYYAQEFIKRDFGFLAFANNSGLVDDPIMREIINISKSLRVTHPQPLKFNPELINSSALALATQSVVMMPILTEAILNNYDNFTLIAQNMANTLNTILLDTLASEYAAGLNVGIINYTFPDWNYGENFIYT